MASRHSDLGLYALGALEDPRRFERHLSRCAECRAELTALQSLRGRLDDAALEVPVPAGMRDRVLRAVRTAQVAELPRARRRWRSGWALRGLQVASVAAALVLVAGIVVRVSGPDAFDPNRAIRLAAPEGGLARGTALIQDGPTGQIVELEVRGLERAPEGKTYECWFVGPNDTPGHQDRVSAGTFEVEGEKTVVRMQASADPRRFPKMGITLEPEDGNPLRTGPKVMVSFATRDL